MIMYVRRIGLLIGIALLSLLGVAQADVITGGNVRVSFRGWISPKTLPRSDSAPIALHVAGTVTPVNGQRPAALKRITVEVNRHAVPPRAGCRPVPGASCSRRPAIRRSRSAVTL
jgi:hypothetical protein